MKEGTNSSKKISFAGAIITFILMFTATWFFLTNFNIWFLFAVLILMIVIWFMGYGVPGIIGMIGGAIFWFSGVVSMLANAVSHPFGLFIILISASMVVSNQKITKYKIQKGLYALIILLTLSMVFYGIYSYNIPIILIGLSCAITFYIMEYLNERKEPVENKNEIYHFGNCGNEECIKYQDLN